MFSDSFGGAPSGRRPTRVFAWWLFPFAFAASCVAQGGHEPPPAAERDKWDELPSAPYPIPDSYQLSLPLESAPGANPTAGPVEFTLCNDIEFSVPVPIAIDAETANAGCGRGCWRSPQSGEIEDSEYFAARTLVAPGRGRELRWRVPVVPTAAAFTDVEAGVYSIDVRMPKMLDHTTYGFWGNGLPDAASRAHASVQVGDRTVTAELHVDPLAERATWMGLGFHRLEPGEVDVAISGINGVVAASQVRFRRVIAPNYENAAWTGYVATNQYSHFWSVGPLLEQLGFGRPGEGQWWQKCAEERRQLRWDEYHARQQRQLLDDAAIVNIGTCVGDWWLSDQATEARAHYASGRYSATAQFEKHLLQAPADRGIQFFSGGSLVPGALEFRAGSTQVLWAYHEELNAVFISFRGTQEPSDFFADLGVWLVDARIEGPWGEVHQGIQNALEEVLPFIEPKLHELRNNAQVYTTGHSLGGALATLLGARLLSQLDMPEQFQQREGQFSLRAIHTFGSPRVGDRAFASRLHHQASRFGTELLRVRHGADAVTRLPPDSGISGIFDYTHVGPMLYVHPEDGRPDFMPSRIPSTWEDSFEHHSMLEYYGHITRAAAENPNQACTVPDDFLDG